MDKENKIVEAEDKKIDKPETGSLHAEADKADAKTDGSNAGADMSGTAAETLSATEDVSSTEGDIPREAVNTQNKENLNQQKNIDRQRKEGSGRPQRDVDRQEKGTDRPKRDADKQEKGTDRPKKDADRQGKGTDRPKRNADRQGKGTDRKKRDADKPKKGTSRPDSDRQNKGTDRPQQNIDKQYTENSGNIAKKRKKSTKERVQKKNQDRILHICLLALIALILIVSVVILVRWNKGNKVEIDPNNAQQFDYEDEDYVVYWDQNQKEGYVDDGELSILFLGDDVISDYTADTGIANLVEANIEDAVVYNAAFSNTTMTAANLNFDENYGLDAFSLYWLGKCIELDTFDLLDNSLPNVGGDTSGYQDAIDTLKSIDFNTLDVIVIYYGLNDYLEGRQITHLGVEDDKTAYTGSLYATVTMLQEKYPNLQIIVASPTYCFVDANDDSTGCDTTDTGEGMLADYMVAAKNIAVMLNVSYMDNYYGIGMNLETAAEKYLEDNMQHPNANARKIIADRITEFIQYRIPLESETNED